VVSAQPLQTPLLAPKKREIKNEVPNPEGAKLGVIRDQVEKKELSTPRHLYILRQASNGPAEREVEHLLMSKKAIRAGKDELGTKPCHRQSEEARSVGTR